MHRKRMAATLGSLAAAGVLLSGCGSNDGAASASSSSPSQNPSARITPTSSARPDFPAVPENATMTLSTNLGDIVIAMNPAAPVTDGSMAYLSSQGYFNNTNCHRIVTSGIYVLQCGDPEGTGRGGPGYKFEDENLPAYGPDNYPAGTVAMANSGPGTNGSQFFIVYENTTLPPSYTIWGQVVSGMDIVKQVAQAGVVGGGTDGKPVTTLTIESTTVQ